MSYEMIIQRSIGNILRCHIHGNIKNIHLPDVIGKYTPIPINNLLALHKQYTNCPTLSSGFEARNLYKSLLFIRNIL